ncbi:ADP-ribosylation factor protein 1 [Dermatophagoides pteronyssinus]|uniref:ADP-ribosylation factor-like protein 6 n=2 Tax=Dermatophagoides pteronyssinus TaxID=6956 RepID=A0A6P6XXT6_DERPT|nr:ADP-ribosylation factor-related protein 1-like [Dermatophagoides pteronyssinus]KAH9417268.1 ADP-ribosylation factor protein 1 [Dermatophagoides pteronyssinus]
MFSLLYGFWRYLFQKDEYYILILGLDNAGKTTFLEQTKISMNPNYRGLNLMKISCTVGLNIGKIDNNGVILNFWDLGGQSELQCLWDKYYAESHAIIYVVDSSDQQRLDESKRAFEKMIENESLKGTPLLFVANKQDVSCMPITRIMDEFRLETIISAAQRDFHFVAVSALKGDGIKESIDWIIETVKKNSVFKPPINVTE